MHHDFLNDNVSIPVRLKNGTLTKIDGSSLPDIDDDSIAYIVLPLCSIKDKDQRKMLNSKRNVLMLKKGTVFRVSLFNRGE